MDRNAEYAVMFVDIAGSTKLYHEFGDTLAQDSIARTLIRMSEIIKNNQGTVIKFIGDEILCYFRDLQLSIKAASEINEALEIEEDPNNIKIKVRIGLHYGTAIVDQSDIYGDTVNVAAAMREIARSTQIIITEAVAKQLPSEQSHKTRKIESSKLKGRGEETVIYELLWKDEEFTQLFGDNDPSNETKAERLQIIHKDGEISLLEDMQPFTIGRETSCSMCIQSNLVSRNHASIVYRKGKFIFIDSSTNGTYICTEEGRNIYIRREELPLLGVGSISLGRSPEEENEHLIQYISR